MNISESSLKKEVLEALYVVWDNPVAVWRGSELANVYVEDVFEAVEKAFESGFEAGIEHSKKALLKVATKRTKGI